MGAAGGTVLVDGYNLVLAWLGDRHIGVEPDMLAGARARLAALLAQWGALRGSTVAIFWDARSSEGPRESAPAGVRVVWADPPAEADDLIVKDAERLVAARAMVHVATEDMGLRRRLPRGVQPLDIKQLEHDLAALTSAPVSGRHVGGDADGFVPAGSGPIDISRLPRRRTPGRTVVEMPPAPAPRPAPKRPAPAPPARDPAAEAARLAEKEKRRLRHEKTRTRRKKP